ncbi:MAG: radical SAM protein, partial [Campylobacterales bacterium]|nr:radical SAM protein [Campylobacterales bacterium]
MLVDKYQREVDYLRVSVTEKCNFRCTYCMPNTPLDWEPKENLLSVDELFQVVKVSIDNGIRKIRITGGEPLIRKDVDLLIKKIFDYSKDIEINLTTNGYFLVRDSKKLKEAGLKRVNVSLDTLDNNRFKKISKIDGLKEVLDGIDEALKVGLKVKLNMVPMKNI